jgi:hypothetical protein
MKSLRIFGIVFWVILFCVSLLPLNTHAQVRSTPVTVYNAPENPVPVIPSTLEKREPVMGSIQFIVPEGYSSHPPELLYVVPQGKILVIETVSGFASLYIGEWPLLNIINSSVAFTIPAVGLGNFYVFCQQVRLYFSQGMGVIVEAQRLGNTTADAVFRISFSGYLIPSSSNSLAP